MGLLRISNSFCLLRSANEFISKIKPFEKKIKIDSYVKKIDDCKKEIHKGILRLGLTSKLQGQLQLSRLVMGGFRFEVAVFVAQNSRLKAAPATCAVQKCSFIAFQQILG